MKNVKFSRDEKRKIVNYIQRILEVKIVSPAAHNTEQCDEDIKKIFNEYNKNKKTEREYYLKSKDLEKELESKKADNDILVEELFKISRENDKLRKKLKHKKFWIF